jgi:hypothetical protein
VKTLLLAFSILTLFSCSNSASPPSSRGVPRSIQAGPVACNGSISKSYPDGSSIQSVNWDEDLPELVDDSESEIDWPLGRPEGLVVTPGAKAGNTRFLLRTQDTSKGGSSMAESVFSSALSVRFLCDSYEVETTSGPKVMPILITGGRSVAYSNKSKTSGIADSSGTESVLGKCWSGRRVRLSNVDVFLVYHNAPPWCRVRDGEIEVVVSESKDWSYDLALRYERLTESTRKSLLPFAGALLYGEIPSDLELETRSSLNW